MSMKDKTKIRSKICNCVVINIVLSTVLMIVNYIDKMLHEIMLRYNL